MYVEGVDHGWLGHGDGLNESASRDHADFSRRTAASELAIVLHLILDSGLSIRVLQQPVVLCVMLLADYGRWGAKRST